MSEYILLADIPMKTDCNFTADELMTVKKNSVVDSLYTVGPWSRVKYNGKEGWIYPFDSSNGFLLTPNNKVSPIKIGDAVFIKSKKDTIHDEYGKLMIVKSGNTRLFFIVVDMLENPKLVRIKEASSDKKYWVKPSSIEKAEIGGGDDDKDNWPSIFYKLGEFFGGSSASASPASRTVIDVGSKSQDQYIQEAATAWYARSSNDDDASITWATAKDNISALELDNLRTIFGMPYQYMPIADMRLPRTSNQSSERAENLVSHDGSYIKRLGVKYGEKIVARMPLLIMVPGVADFMAGFSSKEREKMLENMVADVYGTSYSDSLGSSYINSFSTTMKGTRASFYNMYPAWADYYQYVNPLCRAAAIFMGVDKMQLQNGVTVGNIDWSSDYIKPKAFSDICSYRGACGFYIQSSNQITEDISTNTTQSALANKVNTLSDQGRELMFLSSSVDGMLESAVKGSEKVVGQLTGAAGTAGAAVSQQVTGTKFIKQFEKSGGVVNAIMNGISNTIAGSKMLFPELWQDTSFTRDYSFSVKLDSPDNDPLSLYLNIVVPLIHLICFAAPRNMGPTTYASPFLVKAYYQGFFNINMGIISSMSINKGNEGAWTLKNIPTVVEVNIGIRDLFSNNLTISKTQNGSLNMVTNTPLLDYVANLCGVNINEPDYNKVIILYSMLAKGAAKDYLGNQWNRIVNWFAAGKQSMYSAFIAGNFNPFRSIY